MNYITCSAWGKRLEEEAAGICQNSFMFSNHTATSKIPSKMTIKSIVTWLFMTLR